MGPQRFGQDAPSAGSSSSIQHAVMCLMGGRSRYHAAQPLSFACANLMANEGMQGIYAGGKSLHQSIPILILLLRTFELHVY